MLDAVVLANLLYEIGRDATGPNIKSAFNEYYDERYNRAKADLQASQKVSNIFAGQTWTDDVKRKAMSVLAPASFSRSIFYNTSGYRPQASFLPKVEYHGSGEVEPQKESMRYLREKDMTV
ncbi:hypothetical protein BGX27_001218 [Mortierella sp. AM989]|nr:hypothetical protein BGX27_001218 [Mortierella sp. AM989]